MKETNSDSLDFIDNLFAQARDSETYFEAEPFTQNLLSAIPVNEVTPARSSWGVDILGAVLGLLFVLFMVSPAQVIGLVEAFFSTGITISLMLVFGVVAVYAGASIAAWFLVEIKSRG